MKKELCRLIFCYYLLSTTHLDRIIRQAKLISTCMCSTVAASISSHNLFRTKNDRVVRFSRGKKATFMQLNSCVQRLILLYFSNC